MPTTETRLVSQGTHIDGVELRVSDESVKVSPDTVRRLYDLALRYVMNDATAKQMKKGQEELKERIVAITEAHGSAIRGVRSETDNFQLLIVREVEENWNVELLKTALGELYPNLVSEEFTASVTIPVRQDVNVEDLTKTLQRFLVEHGVPEDQLDRFLETGVDIIADTERARELAAEGKIRLPDGAMEEVPSWAIKSLALKTTSTARKKKGKKKATA